MTRSSQDDLRRRALKARRELDPQLRSDASQRIAETFLRSRYFYSAKNIGCFLPMPDEVDTSLLFARAWQSSKRIWCPVVAAGRRLEFVAVTRATSLRKSAFGILEPTAGDLIDPFDLDVVVVPLVAFDALRRRIGMGGGYYDRTFARLRTRQLWLRPKLVGFAFDCQKVPKIKANPWDIRLFDVITETA